MNFIFSDQNVGRWELLGILGILSCLFAVLAVLLPQELLVVLLAVGSMATVYYSTTLLIAHHSDRLPGWVGTVPIWLTFLAPLTITTVVVARYWASVTLTLLLLVVALLAVFFYYWFVIPLALYQKFAEQGRSRSVDEWPQLSVLVPAYNEANYIGPCLDALLRADYPREKLEILVVDDGSTDDTFEEAQRRVGDVVTVIRKENGGKHSALNDGLTHASADLIVTIDADSLVAEDALCELVRSFQHHPDAGAVAGNVKISNRESFVTNVQALEYVIGINTFRRAFDLLGIVTVVPGCLGAFRRETLERIHGYSADTLTEDFDATIAVLKQGVPIHHSDAVVYTEAPDTWTDLYNQRLRWFRGNVQTVWKHRHVFLDGQFGLLHRIAFPYVLFSMSVLPALGVAIVSLVVWSLISGSYLHVFGMLMFFVVLQVLLSILAVRVDDDDLSLVWYAPFSIVGYKQFLDAVLIRSLFDVLRRRNLRWTSARRSRQRDVVTTEKGH
ncbi:glycosyltransferase [Haloprofundus salinisoli]|uniref:glycosyltransferase n=1 Tax=Haloprofundus salinisoli TaxID=2876193 RepID=UPI001CCB3645|nr:glycosyltransferase [Haloprofundus salinisoli]